MSPLAIAFIWIALVVGVPAGLAALLRAAGAPGGRVVPAIAGGVLAGLLLGPSIGGRAFPDFRERVFVGGVDERAELATARARADAHTQAILATGVSPAALEERRFEDARVIAPLQRKADEATRSHRTMAYRWTALLAALLGMGASRTVRAALPHAARRPRTFVAGLAIPPTALLATGLLAALILPIDRADALWASVALAATTLGPLRHAWPTSGRTALALGLGGAAACLVGAIAAGRAAIAGAIGVALGVPDPRRACALAAWHIALPALTCAALLSADWHALKTSREFWTALVFVVIVSGDIRWACTRLALRIINPDGARRPWATSATLIDHGASALQVLLTLALLQTGRISTELAAALIVGALIVELSVPLRAKMARLLDARPA